MPQLDPSVYAPQIVWLAICFALLFLLLWRVALPRVAEVLKAREAKIEGDLATAATLKEDAETVLKAYEKAMADARASAQGTMRQAAAEIADEAAKRNAALDERLTRQVKDAEERIGRAKAQAVAAIGDIAGEAASRATERLVGRAPDGAAVKEAVAAAMKEGR